MIDDPLGMRTLEEGLRVIDPRCNLQPGDLFILASEMSERRPTAFEVVSREIDRTGVYYSAWELEGPKGKRYRGKHRAISFDRVGRVIPTETVTTWAELRSRPRRGDR